MLGMISGLFGMGMQGHAANDQAAASLEAAEFEAAQNAKAIEQQRGQFDYMNSLLNPYYETGAQSLPYLQEGSTAGGYGGRISDIMGQDYMQQAIGENMRGVNDQLASAGGRRSGFGANTATNSIYDMLSNQENMLNQRNQSLAGQTQTTGLNMGNFGAGNANAITRLMGNQADAYSTGINNANAINMQGMNQMINTGAAVADYYRR